MIRHLVCSLVAVLLLCAAWFVTPAKGCPECEKLAEVGLQASGSGTRWSDPKTWAGGKLPRAGDLVVIPENREVLLDVNPPQLKGLLVKGQLRFDRRNLELQTGWILVAGKKALLEIGTETKPFQEKAVLTFHGMNVKESIIGKGLMGTGTKFLCAMEGGQLELHGVRRDAVSWTQLSAHAKPGDKQLTLKDKVDWLPGDQIAIAPSSYSAFEAEQVTVKAVNGNVVHFEPALKHTHWGTVQKYDGMTLDERAEVGLLTRNIRLQGADNSLSAGFGGHVMIMPGGTARVEGVELFQMGQRGLQGRYPMHWHLVDRYGDGKAPGKGQYAKNNSVHHSFQRAIVVHGTSDVLVESNVAYDVANHCYVPAEDGDEVNNVFRNNLGMLVRLPAKEHFAFRDEKGKDPQNERHSSVFWMRNPNQVFEGNHAAGCDAGNGFFFDSVRLAEGIERYKHLNGMRFVNNVAHSNGNSPQALFFGGVTYQFANTRFGLFTADVAKGVRDEDRNKLVYRNFMSYKNQKGGAWVESAREHLTNCVFADQPVGVLSTANANLNRVVIVGQTENTLGEALPTRGKDERSKQPVGIRFNKRNAGNQFELTNLTVINCPVGLLATSAAPSGHVKGCKFENVPIRFYSNGKVYGNETKLDKMVLRDDDGSLTGLGTPAQITLVRVSEKSKERKDWNVFVTPR